MIPRGIVNVGNLTRLQKVIEKAMHGDEITVGFIGGSITQGSNAQNNRNCYAFGVYQWLKNRFSLSKVNYINAGIGATTSQYAVARVERDLLVYDPDIVFVEFSVNDEENSFFEETYEGLLRNILSCRTNPFVVLINNIYYDTGRNAQEYHNRIGKAYGIPIITMKDSIYQDIKMGKLKASDLTADQLHPNDRGHRLITNKVTEFLEYLIEEAIYNLDDSSFIEPVTQNRFQYSRILNNINLTADMKGFLSDCSSKVNGNDVFKNGWFASTKGAYFEVKMRGSYLAVQYRKTINKPAPVCRLNMDEGEDIILDGNASVSWGDCLYLQTLSYDLEDTEHTIRVTVTEADSDIVTPFYLVAFIIGK